MNIIVYTFNKRLVYWLSIFILGLFSSCRQEELFSDINVDNIRLGLSDIEIVFTPQIQSGLETKADVVNLSNFNVVCVTGASGSESFKWSITDTDGHTGKYWPSSNPGYKFYGCNAPMTFNASGCLVSALNSLDVVVCYKSNPSYGTANSLQFNHIFGKIGDVQIIPETGFVSSDITEVNIRITPKTGGTYNIRTGSWSNISTGNSTIISPSNPGTRQNDLYLVPGEYLVSGSWYSKGKPFEGSGNIVVSQGEQLFLNITLGGAMTISVNAESIIWSQNARVPDSFDFSLIQGKRVVSVSSGGKKVEFSKGNLQAIIGASPTNYIATASSWKLAEHQYDMIGNTAGNNSFAVGSTVDLFGWVGDSADYDSYGLCTNTSYNNAYYGTVGSEGLKTDWGSIPDVIDLLGSGWRVLTSEEWNYLLSYRSNRANPVTVCGVTGLLILPDDWSWPNGVKIPATYTYADNIYNAEQWSILETYGAIFLPACGVRYGTNVNSSSSSGFYWGSPTTSNLSSPCCYFYNNSQGYRSSQSRYSGCAVRLVRDLN